jgi:cell division protein FtsX
MQRKTHSRGSLAGVIGGLVVGVLMMYIGLFMISAVYNATALLNTSPFYTLQNSLIVTTGTIFTVLGLVIIVVALTVAIKSMMQVSGGG